jgi:hypothetical protein
VLDRDRGLLGPVLFVLVLSALFGAATKLDDFLVLFLRQDSGEAFLPAFSRNFEFFGAILRALGFGALGLGCALLFARLSRRPFALAARPFATLLIPCALTAASVVSLLISPSYPYGLGLVLSLNLEGWFKPILTAALFAAVFLRELEVPEFPRLSTWSSPLIVAAALLVFTMATPRGFYQNGAGQGNMFKYLRMANALAGAGSLDIEKAGEGADATIGSFLKQLPRMGTVYVEESMRLASALAKAALEGKLYTGEMTASRANRSMFRSAEGGIYYINAPGPGILLVPAVLADRALNRAFGGNRQLAVILFWQLLGALLVLEMVRAATFVASRDAALVTAFAAAVIVPILFYTFQIYPELPAALFLLFAFRKLVSTVSTLPGARRGCAAALPGFPKYSVVASSGSSGSPASPPPARQFTFEPGGSLFSSPLVLSAYSVLLHHALTEAFPDRPSPPSEGRLRPSGFSGTPGAFPTRERPLRLAPSTFSLFQAQAFGRANGRVADSALVIVSPSCHRLVSLLAGAVSTMGRHISSILLVLPMALVVKRAFEDGVVAGAGVVVFAASLAVSASFTADLVPSWQPDLLWDRTLYSDPAQYLPDFVSEGFLGSGPAHVPKVLVQLLAAGALVLWLRGRVAHPRSSRAFVGGAGATLAGLLALAAVVEHLPRNPAVSGKPRFRQTHVLEPGRELAVDGEHGFEGEGAWVPGGGRTRFVLLARASTPSLTLSLLNGPEENVVEVRERGSAAFVLDLPASGPHERTVLLR